MGWLNRFMMGRRGTDQLSLALIVGCVVVTLVSSVLSWFATNTAAYVVYIVMQCIAAALLILSTCRMFSRNIAARERENQKFLSAWRPFVGWIKRDRKHFRYLSCSGCHAQLRVPKGKGTIIVTCPKCHRETKIKT